MHQLHLCKDQFPAAAAVIDKYRSHSERNAALKIAKNSQTSVMAHRNISTKYNLGKLAIEAPHLASEKANQDWK